MRLFLGWFGAATPTRSLAEGGCAWPRRVLAPESRLGSSGRGRCIALAAVAGFFALAATGCAQIPMASGVVAGHGDAANEGPVSIIAAGPIAGSRPDAIVHGFLLASQAGPTASTPFAVAKEYLTADAVGRWRPGEQVTILADTPTLSLTAGNPDSERDGDTVGVTASGTAVAFLDAHGVYREAPEPVPVAIEFTMLRVGDEWRISDLDDGLILPEQVFTSAFRQTRLYFASPNERSWVPDVRWFPRQTWQTNAVQELFAGPPPWLEHSVRTGVPAGATLTLDTVTQGTGNAIQVRVSDEVAEASEAQRGLLLAQLRATLADETGQPEVELLDANGPVPVPTYQQPRLARTNGSALAVRDDELFRAVGNELRPLRPGISLFGLDPTALAVGSGRDGQVVVRDGESRLIRIDRSVPSAPVVDPATPPGGLLTDPALDYEPGLSPSPTLVDLTPSPLPGVTAPEPPGADADASVTAPVVGEDDEDGDGFADVFFDANAPVDVLLEGTRLIAPSIDSYGMVWTGEVGGPIMWIWEHGVYSEVVAPWLIDREVSSIRVAPDGVRVAIVSTELNEAGEPVGEPVLDVSGVRRDVQGYPIALDAPKQVGASLRGISNAVWQDDATLAVVASNGGEPSIFLVGVGGLDSTGGLPRELPGVGSPVGLTASVGTGNMFAIDPDLMLHLRQSTLWPTVDQPVTLIAYPG